MVKEMRTRAKNVTRGHTIVRVRVRVGHTIVRVRVQMADILDQFLLRLELMLVLYFPNTASSMFLRAPKYIRSRYCARLAFPSGFG